MGVSSHAAGSLEVWLVVCRCTMSVRLGLEVGLNGPIFIIKRRMGTIPDSFYTKMELVSLVRPKI